MDSNGSGNAEPLLPTLPGDGRDGIGQSAPVNSSLFPPELDEELEELVDELELGLELELELEVPPVLPKPITPLQCIISE